MSQELEIFKDKSFAGKWRNRLPESVKMKFAIEAEHAKAIMASNDGFEKCTEASVQQALMSASMIGLSLSPQLQHLYLIPRYNKDQKATLATLLVSYKGMMEVVNRDGHVVSVKSKVVYANEAFEYTEGTTTEIRHKIIADAKKRGPMIGAYCVANSDMKTFDKLNAKYQKLSDKIRRLKNDTQEMDMARFRDPRRPADGARNGRRSAHTARSGRAGTV